MSNAKGISRKKGGKGTIDINTFCKEQWPKLKEAAKTAIRHESDPDKMAAMEDELSDFAIDVASHFMATRYKFPESAADFEKLLKEAEQDVKKQKRLQEIFDQSVKMAGKATDFTQKVVAFLCKYGKHIVLG